MRDIILAGGSGTRLYPITKGLIKLLAYEALTINWILKKEELQLSVKDTVQPKLSQTDDLFKYEVDYYA